MRQRAAGTFALLLTASFFAGCSGGGSGAGPKRTVRDVRLVTASELERGLPIELDGIVTHVDREWGILVLQDQTGAISADISNVTDGVLGLAPGRLIHLRGTAVADPEDATPVVGAPSITWLGEEPMPSPLRVTVGSLDAQTCDGRWIEVSGVVGASDIWLGRLRITLTDGRDAWRRAFSSTRLSTSLC